MVSPHWPVAALPVRDQRQPAALPHCAYCGGARTSAPAPIGSSRLLTPFAYGRRACLTCRGLDGHSLEQRRLTRWLTFARTVQKSGSLQRILTGPMGFRVGHCLFPLMPTLRACREFMSAAYPLDASFRCLGSQLPHTQEGPVLGGGGWQPAHLVHAHPIYAQALRDGAPLLAIGDYLRTREGSPRAVCRAYAAPPDVCHRTLQVRGGGQRLATLAPGTYIGPIEEFCVSARFVTVLVRSYWINVWLRTPHRHRGSCLVTHVLASEVNRWRDSGWMDWLSSGG